MTSLDAALSYLRLGWSVFPLVPKTKQPAIPWAPFQKARMGEGAATSLWSEHPDWGVAIVTGAISGLVVIDVDPRNGGDFDDVVSRVEPFSDQIITAKTGGGGAHIFCQHPGGHVPCGKMSLPGVDRKGDGGYIVAPPSIHPSGEAYRWSVNPSEGGLLAMPRWVLEAPAPLLPTGEERESWIAETLAYPDQCTPGCQEETLTKLCWWASKHLPEDIALAVLGAWAGHLPLSRPSEPWEVEHVRDRLSSAYQKRALNPDPGKVSGVSGGGTELARPHRLRDKVMTTRTYTESQTERDDWIVEDFLAPGAYTEIIGVMKEGKSTFVGGLLRSVTTGIAFLGRPTRKTKALWLTEQAGMSFKKTVERAQLQASDDILVLTIADTYGLSWQSAAEEAVDIAVENGAGILIVDTLARLAGITEEDESSSVLTLNPFLRARAAGIAVVFVRHGRKAGGAVNVAARGSGAITGEMDICLLIRATQGVGSDYRLLEGVSRLGDVIEEHLKYEDGSYVKGEEPKHPTQHRKDEALDRFRACLEPLKAKTQADLVAQSGLSKTTVRNYILELQNQGVIDSTPEGFILKAAGGIGD